MTEQFDIKAWFASRDSLRSDFLNRTGYGTAQISVVSEDCAMRRYLRLRKDDGSTAILMESLPDDDLHATPGHKIADFIRIGGYLNSIGINAPDVYEADEAQGYVLIEDFGDLTFKKAIEEAGQDRYKLYELATDVLSHIREHADPSQLQLPRYEDSVIHSDRRNVIDWYQAEQTGIKPSEDVVQSYLKVWDDIEASLPPCPKGILHVDYHFENLMWIPDNEGVARCGVLDFQQAKYGPVPYDLANLLYDARTTVPELIKTDMLARYCAAMSAEERDVFQRWMFVLSAQFHCRVIGLFVRMARRDGKFGYLPHIPRLAAYLREELKSPVLAPLADWFMQNGIRFEEDSLPQVKAA